MPKGRKQRIDEQPCWHCAKFAGGCSWSTDFTPIEGWKAEKVRKMYGSKMSESYKIIECNEFVCDD